MVIDKIHVYYRISDKGNIKTKMDGINKYDCFLNAKSVLESEGGVLHIIADNCSKETLVWLDQQSIHYIKSKRGNSGSFRFMLDLIAKERSKNEVHL